MQAATALRDRSLPPTRPRGAARVRRALAAAIAAVLTGGCGRGDAGATGAKAAQSSGEVVVYVSVDDTVARPILRDFEAKTGISVRALTDTEATKTTGLVQRLRLEKGESRADLFWSGEVFQTVALAAEGAFAPIPSPLLEGRPEDTRDARGLWAGMALRARVVCFQTERVPHDASPRTLHDLLSPVHRGRVVMARPAFGTTRGHMAAILAAWGEDEMVRWLRSMRANRVRLVDGNSAVVRAIAMGEADVGLTDTDDVEAGRKLGWPIGMNIVQHTLPGRRPMGALLIPSTVALVAEGPNPSSAVRLIEFLLSPEVERRMIEAGASTASVTQEADAAPMPPFERIAAAMSRAMELCDRELGP